MKAFKLRYLSALRSSPAIQPKRPHVLTGAPRNIGGSATLFLLKVGVTSTAAWDGLDRRVPPGALAGQEKVVQQQKAEVLCQLRNIQIRERVSF